MKCMNCMGCQALLLVGLALVGGGVANLTRSSNPVKILPGTTDLYAAPEPAPRKTETSKTPAGSTPETPVDGVRAFTGAARALPARAVPA